MKEDYHSTQKIKKKKQVKDKVLICCCIEFPWLAASPYSLLVCHTKRKTLNIVKVKWPFLKKGCLHGGIKHAKTKTFITWAY